MADDRGAAATVQRLLDEYDTYDQQVDVVSAFEWMFTQTKQLPSTVRRFERFPKIKVAHGLELTPDFTVLFTDGTALVGEISKLAVHDNSIEKACAQIGQYAELDRVPDATGSHVQVTDLGVLQIVPVQVGLAAVRRIIKDRYMDPDHPYKPAQAPCIAQFSRDPDRYTFQRIPDPDNGTLPATKEPMTIGWLLDQGLNVPADGFKDIKARRKFMNDPINPLYLATHLWTATWPSRYGSNRDDIVVDAAETAKLLRDQFEKGRAAEVRAALQLLQSAGLAALNDDATWTVSRKTLRHKGERDIHKIIANMSAQQVRPVVTPRNKKPPQQQYGQDSLF